jgi:hypothetical protein
MTVKDFALELVESAVGHAAPKPERRRWLTPHEAIREACRSDRRTSGNWGYWIKGLEDDVRKAIDAEIKRRRELTEKRKATERHQAAA